MKLEIKNRTVYVNGKAIPLISGEVHYWRLNPNQWEVILDQVRELGLDIVSTYVPWEFHEVSKHRYDFTGETDPRRNLKAFLELLEKKGFWILVRPGPYIYSEWKNLGIPDRVISYHRSHPKFVQESRQYLQEVFKILLPHFVTNGGRIILAQPDNELDPFLYNYEDQLGLRGGPGPFQDYLKVRYKTIKALNRAWEASYKTFDDAQPFCAVWVEDQKDWARFLDFKKFIYWHVERMGRVWCEEFRKLGCDLPLYLNLYACHEVQPWKALGKCANFSALDMYPTEGFEGESGEHQDFLEKGRALRSVSCVPFIAEFQSGTWHGYHTQSGMLSPNQYRLSAISALLSGITGWNWYMLVNRDNWYLCPIDEWGQVREEIASVIRDLIRVFKEIQPHKLKKLTGIGVTFYPLHFTTRAIAKNDALLQSLYQTDLDYEFVDVEEELPKKKIIFYVGDTWLPRPGHEHLLKYVEQGGILVTFLKSPVKDEDKNPLNLLEFQQPDSILGERDGLGCEKHLDLVLGDITLQIKSPFLIYNHPQGKPIEAKVREFPTYVSQWNLIKGHSYHIGYFRKLGRGMVVQIGTNPTPELLSALLKYLKVSTACQSMTSGIQTGTFQGEKGFYIFVAHTGRENKSVHLHLSKKMDGINIATDLFSRRTYPVVQTKNGKFVEIPIERKSGTCLFIKK